MNSRQLFIKLNNGTLDEFISGLDVKNIKLFVRDLKDEIERYEKASENYSTEKKEKYSKPYIESRLLMINKLIKNLK